MPAGLPKLSSAPAVKSERRKVILDPEASHLPLRDYDDGSTREVYGLSSSLLGMQLPEPASECLACPPRPAGFRDPYLYPTLAADEKDRLRRFYLLTEGIEQDDELVEHLRELVSIIRDSFGGEKIVNLGFSDLDDYIQILADGMEAVTVPRREVRKTCPFVVA